MITYVLSDGGAQPLATEEGLAVLVDLLLLSLDHEDGENQEPTEMRIAVSADDAITLAAIIVAAATPEENN